VSGLFIVPKRQQLRINIGKNTFQMRAITRITGSLQRHQRSRAHQLKALSAGMDLELFGREPRTTFR